MTEIFYGDIFVINDTGCVVMEHGKSKTCRPFTGDSTEEVMTDSHRRNAETGKLMAYGDAGMVFPLLIRENVLKQE